MKRKINTITVENANRAAERLNAPVALPARGAAKACRSVAPSVTSATMPNRSCKNGDNIISYTSRPSNLQRAPGNLVPTRVAALEFVRILGPTQRPLALQKQLRHAH